MPTATSKKRANGHRSRKGTNGKPTTAKHNDREFDVSKADHIDDSLLHQNQYWKLVDLSVVCPSAKINPEATFDEYEQQIYEMCFFKMLEIRNAKQIAARHKERVQSIEQFRKNAKVCPEESIWTIGNRDNRVSPELLMECFAEFLEWHRTNFPNVMLLDAALHCDEPDASPHIHLRQVWFHTAHDTEGNQYLEIHQNNALKEMGISRPEPDKKESRYNNAKVTYTAMLHQEWLDIAERHGISVERTPQDKSKSGLPLAKLKAKTLEENIAELEKRLAQLNSDIEDKQDEWDVLTSEMEKKKAELKEVNAQITEKKLAITVIPPRPELPDEPVLSENAGFILRQAHKTALKQFEQKLSEAKKAQEEWDRKYSALTDLKGIATHLKHRQDELEHKHKVLDGQLADVRTRRELEAIKKQKEAEKERDEALRQREAMKQDVQAAVRRATTALQEEKEELIELVEELCYEYTGQEQSAEELLEQKREAEQETRGGMTR